MALRRLPVIVLLALRVLGVADAAIRSYPLDERCVYTIRLSVDEPTTCVFPAGIAGLVGAGVSEKTADEPSVLLTHAAGAEYFSLRATRPEARAALNVLCRGKVYVLSLVTGGEPDRAVVFLAPEKPAQPAPLPAGVAQALLERAKDRERFGRQYPTVNQGIEVAARRIETVYRNFTVTVEEVCRFDEDDVVVLKLRLASTVGTAVRYLPKAISVRVGADFYPAMLVDASGLIPATGSAVGWVLLHGRPGGGRANLEVREEFSPIVPCEP